VNETFTLDFTVTGYTVKSAKIFRLDKSSYVMYFNSTLGKEVLTKSTVTESLLPASPNQRLSLDGYSVSVVELALVWLEFMPEQPLGSAPLPISETLRLSIVKIGKTITIFKKNRQENIYIPPEDKS
jgi:hypothetical protein